MLKFGNECPRSDSDFQDMVMCVNDIMLSYFDKMIVHDLMAWSIYFMSVHYLMSDYYDEFVYDVITIFLLWQMSTI